MAGSANRLVCAGVAGVVAALAVLPGTALAAEAAAVAADTGTVSGLVWFDRNRDQVRQGGEPGADGQRVMVTNTGTGEIFGATTDGAGIYVIDGLPAGRYRVSADNSGYLPTTREDVEVTVGAGSTANAYFGIDGGTIYGLAWFDANRDGVRQTFEPRLRAITITARGVRFAVATTGPDGTYAVEDLPAGKHVLQFERPYRQLGFTTPFVGDPATDSDVADTEQGLAFVELGISTGGVEDAQHIDAGYLLRPSSS